MILYNDGLPKQNGSNNVTVFSCKLNDASTCVTC